MSHLISRRVSAIQYDIFREGDHIHITLLQYVVIIDLLVTVVSLLLCLVYKFNFIIGMNVQEKYTV